jgi:hypothetical protein
MFVWSLNCWFGKIGNGARPEDFKSLLVRTMCFLQKLSTHWVFCFVRSGLTKTLNESCEVKTFTSHPLKKGELGTKLVNPMIIN